MSAPDTNIDKQTRRHRPALWGIWGGLGLVAIMLVIWLASVFFAADAPEGADVQVQPGVGTVETN